MNILQWIFTRRLALLALVCATAWLLALVPAAAQSSGPTVDVCSSTVVGSYPEDTRVSTCLQGDASGLNASVMADVDPSIYNYDEGFKTNASLVIDDNGNFLYGTSGEEYEGPVDLSYSFVPNLFDVYDLQSAANLCGYEDARPVHLDRQRGYWNVDRGFQHHQHHAGSQQLELLRVCFPL